MRGILNVCAVKAPGYGDRRKAMLGDIAILTGGQAIFKDLGIDLDAVKICRPGHGQEGHHRRRQHDDRRRGRQQGGHRRPGRADPQRDRDAPTATTTARSSRSGWPSWPAAWPRSTCGAATETEMKERKALLEDARARDPGGPRRRHRPRRRRGPAALRQGARQARARRRRGAWAPRSSQNVLDAPAAGDRRERRRGRRRGGQPRPAA